MVTPAGAQPGVEVVASGLDNPRGLSFGPDGYLYVAESGRGGAGPCLPGPEGEVCFGPSGAITRVRLNAGRQERVLTNLPSLAAPDGSGALGPTDISFSGSVGRFVTIGLGLDPARRTEFPELANMAWLVRPQFMQHTWRDVADLGAFEAANNPDGDLPDTNPTSVLASGAGQIVVDAGANALLSVNRRGTISTIAVFPERLVDAPPFLGLPPGAQIPMDAVPTAVAEGRDGAYYVSQLTGFPFPVGGANVYRVVPGEEPEVFASGFTNIIDLAFGRRGELFVLEIATNGLASGGPPIGALKRVNTDGSVDLITDELFAPGGLTVRGRNVYVSNCGVCAAGGEVLRIDLG